MALPSSSSRSSPLVVDPLLWDVVSRMGQEVSFGPRYCLVGPRNLAFPMTLTMGENLYHKDTFPHGHAVPLPQSDNTEETEQDSDGVRAGSQGTVVLYTRVEHSDDDGDSPPDVPEQVVLKSYHYWHCAIQEMRLDQRLLALQEAGEWPSRDVGQCTDEPFLMPLAWVRRQRKDHRASTAGSRHSGARNAQWFRVAPYMETDMLDLLAQPDTRSTLTRADRVTLAHQLVQAVHAFHKVGLVFGDLKPENIMLQRRKRSGTGDGDQGDSGASTQSSRYRLCLVDGGFVCLATEGHLLPPSTTTTSSMPASTTETASIPVEIPAYCGHSPNYVSPQRAAVCPYNGTFRMRKEDDVWSLGLIVGILLSGTPGYYVDAHDTTQTLFNLTQFDASHFLVLLHHHMRYLFGKEYVDHAFWTDARSMLSECLHMQEARRTTTQVLLTHPLWKYGHNGATEHGPPTSSSSASTTSSTTASTTASTSTSASTSATTSSSRSVW
jgi:hypothetical protein